MLEKKLEYSNMMISQDKEQRGSLWGQNARLYKGKYYIDENDSKAFQTEEEVDKAIENELSVFLKENNLLSSEEE